MLRHIQIGILMAGLGLGLVVSCSRVRPVQLAPPVAVPPDLVWGYGVERVQGNPDEARRRAYLSAVDDLLSRGPVLVSRSVVDRTIADDRDASRSIETTFRLRAASMLDPRFVREGFEDGFSWVVVGASEPDIERGWNDFLEWRDARIAEAGTLFEEAEGPNRLALLEASAEILEEAGAEMAPGLLYRRVRLALESERAQVARIRTLRQEVEGLIDNGDLLAAERRLSDALVAGLSLDEYDAYSFRIEDQRSRAESEVVAGDTLYDGGRYGEAMERYDRARRLDANHPGLSTRAARAEAADHRARGETTARTLGVIGGVVTEFFRWQKEEARQDARDDARDDARREREEREQGERDEQRRRDEERRRREDAERGSRTRHERIGAKVAADDDTGTTGESDTQETRQARPKSETPVVQPRARRIP